MMLGNVKSEFKLHGRMNPTIRLSGFMNPEAKISGKLSIISDYEDYIGEYEIIPKITAQTILTDDKHLTKDVVVKEIPYYEVDNLSFGQTVIIGG